MEPLSIKKILELTNGTLLCGREDIVCEDFSKDARQIQEGEIYVGIKGEKFDGSQFYEEALQQGAAACIIENITMTQAQKENYQDKAVVLVEDTIEAIAQIAIYKRSLYDIPVVAITGSVGKTSTKDIIASVVQRKYKTLKTEGNMNNHIGLPLTILRLKDHEALVIEMGMNHFGEISYLTNIAKPTLVVLTNIGTAHIGNLGSRENILKAKMEILEGLAKKGTVIVNEDNDLLQKWNKANTKYPVVTYGIEQLSDFMAKEIQIGEESSTYLLETKQQTYRVKVPISGRHFVYNSLAAISVGISLEITMEDCIQGVEAFELTKKRMDTEKLSNGVMVINDSYNASYDSMKSALEYLAEVKGNRKIAILGNMMELGEYTKSLHEKVGEEVYHNQIDLLITVGEYAKDISKKAVSLGYYASKTHCLENVEEVIALLKGLMQKGDIVLLKAANSMNFTQILEKIR